jgi:hypothetical protein
MKPFSKLVIIIIFLTLFLRSVSGLFPYSVKIDNVSTVTYVIDGDTFEIESGYDIRLADVDAPEENETGYAPARKYLCSLILNKIAYLDIDNITVTDPYGRLVCLAYVRENSTHFLNINKALVTSGYADVWNFTNNEFDPDDWSLYVEADEEYLLDFQALFMSNFVRVIYPSDDPGKPLVLGPAMLSDWTASGLILPRLENYTEGIDTNPFYVNQTTGKPAGKSSEGVITFGGPDVNMVTYWAENNANAPIKFIMGLEEFYFKHSNGSEIPGASLPMSVINFDEDMFVIEVFNDYDGRYVMIIQGFGWKGTYAGGKYFEETIYPDLKSYPYNWIIAHWDDTNGNSFVNGPSDGDTYTVIAEG